MRKNLWILFLVFFFVLSHLACSPDHTELTQRYATVYNSHNVDEIVNLYANDAVFEVVGQFTLKGKDQIRGITEYDSVLNIKMSISNIRAYGDTVRFELSETNDWLRASEIGEAHYSGYFLFEDGLIKHLRAEAKPGTQHAFNDVLTPLMTWAREEKGNVLAEMMPEGLFIYDAKNAKRTLALLQEWKNSQK